MVGWILKKILGSKNQRELKRVMPIVRRINEFEAQFQNLSDEALRAKTAAWKEELAKFPISRVNGGGSTKFCRKRLRS